ncbi:unnamed protein product [Blepharisma stoltei]|uniref:Uncharacterized protein n=1 Tax=Blepharisma stoltei TaxID=1481888 RepID=A0AAU9IMC0_9CILI|nr:unnamed protein product [Blepharisma stoltei]
MSEFKIPSIPKLSIPSLSFTVDDVSPRSEDFRECPLINYPISFQAPISKEAPNKTTANFPLTSNFSKDIKNPLLSTENAFLQLIKHQSAEIDSLHAENNELKSKLSEAEAELKSLRRIKVLMREQERKISNLQTSLDLATEECNDLKMQLSQAHEEQIEWENSWENEANLIDLAEFYSDWPPRRIWKDPAPEINEKLENLKSKIKRIVSGKL